MYLITVMSLFNEDLSTMNTISSQAKDMFNLLVLVCMHCEMSSERKEKKGTSDTLERTLGMVGNEFNGCRH